ncbi:MAG: DNA internalization-related competence protein ComEC/Rec2 [Deltaproteobacteria bacterium]|nr:DNA internalization-related competence protein ComEC/Rec2 [Deltaproteobacteria bacterium]
MSPHTARHSAVWVVPPLIPVTIALLAGQLLIGRQLALPLAVMVTLGALGASASAWRRTRLGGVMLLAFAWGNWAAGRVVAPQFAADHIGNWCGARAVEVEARLLDDAEVAPRRNRLRLEVERVSSAAQWQPAHGRVLLTVRTLHSEWQAGDRLRARLRLRRPRNFGNPGEFDYEAHLARQGIYVTSFVAEDSALTLVERRPNSGWLSRWRRGVGGVMNARLSAYERALLRALIIGDSAAVPRELQEKFTRAGVNHVLSISGLHVGMVAAFGYLLWRWLLARSRWLLLRTNVPKLAVTASVIPVLLYAGIAGSNTATIRSVIMVLVFLGAVLVDRERNLLVSLAAAALVISLLWPGAVLDISFQLSFMAVLFLVLAMGRFWPWWRRWEELRLVRLRSGWVRYARPVAAYLAVSLAALAGTAPLTAFHFNQVSLVAVLANAVVVPLLGTAAVALGLLAALTYPLSAGLAGLWVLLAWPCLWLGRNLTGLFAAFPGAALRVVTPSLLELVLMYAALLLLLCLDGRWRTRCLTLLALVGALDAAWWYHQRYHRPDLRVTFLSVGQGDSAVVECPGSMVMVIDGGGLGDGTFDVGERVVAPFLWRRKIAHIDALVLSHPQWDHFGGLTFIARQFTPGEFWYNGDRAAKGVRFAELQEALATAGVRQVVAAPGMQRPCGDAVARVVGPAAPAASVNDRSLVVQFERGGTEVLFTGDIERNGEAALVAAAAERLRSTILKVPHHGSATSSTPAFVAAVAPSMAIVSVGFDNRFGFPHPNTESAYRELGASVWRTDRDGAVTVSIGPTGTIRTQLQRHLTGHPQVVESAR